MFTGKLKPFFFVWSIFTITFVLWHDGKIPTQFIIKGVSSGGGGVTPLTFLKFVGILTKCVGKISWLNVFEYFIMKNETQNSISIQSGRNQTFNDDGSF